MGADDFRRLGSADIPEQVCIRKYQRCSGYPVGSSSFQLVVPEDEGFEVEAHFPLSLQYLV